MSRIFSLRTESAKGRDPHVERPEASKGTFYKGSITLWLRFFFLIMQRERFKVQLMKLLMESPGMATELVIGTIL